jgi:aminopeptidase N
LGETAVGYDPISFNVRYENGTEKLLRGSHVEVDARMLDGLERYAAAFNWDLPGGHTTLRTSMRFLLRRSSDDLRYLLYPEEWEPDALNSTWDNSVRHRYEYGIGNGHVLLNVRNSSIGSVNAFAQATLTAINENRLGRLNLRTRCLLQFGTGSTPRESQLFIDGASPEEMMENKYIRSVGFVPYEWLGSGIDVGHFQAGGGLGLRGYAGYFAPELNGNGDVILTYRGNSGAAFNGELDLDGLLRIRPKATRDWLHIDAYLFGDVGSMGYRQTTDAGTVQLRLAPPRADAGAGVALTIKKFWRLVDIEPLTIRFDAPLVLSNLPSGEVDHVAFRYVVGINRSF